MQSCVVNFLRACGVLMALLFVWAMIDSESKNLPANAIRLGASTVKVAFKGPSSWDFEWRADVLAVPAVPAKLDLRVDWIGNTGKVLRSTKASFELEPGSEGKHVGGTVRIEIDDAVRVASIHLAIDRLAAR